ncbi:MAG: glycosyltransferase family 2 protein [Bacteroidetes bacterium]|nr:glycosyltransferase family 2 protein [Bacteroidota bacterium]
MKRLTRTRTVPESEGVHYVLALDFPNVPFSVHCISARFLIFLWFVPNTGPLLQTSEQNPALPRRGAAGEGAGTDISVVVPSYNENDSLPELSARLAEVLSGLTESWEVWFIDDGSHDNSMGTLRALHARDPRFKVARFRRNYGKSAALAVGFERAAGRYVITMDADLQDDPAEIPALIAKIDEGYDMVSGWKKKRYDPVSKTIPSKFFNFVTGRLSGIDIHDFNCGLKAYRGEVVKSVNIYGEMHRYIPVLAKMAGFTVTELVVQHHPRKYGHTKFGLSRFFKGFLDLLSVLFTSRYTQRPLHVFGTMGGAMLVGGLFINGYLTVQWLMGYPVGDRPMLLLGILLMLLGIQLISTGLLAEMITKSDANADDYHVSEELG